MPVMDTVANARKRRVSPNTRAYTRISFYRWLTLAGVGAGKPNSSQDKL